MSFMRPKNYSLRNPTDNKKTHGDVVNPPRMAQIGGLSSTGKVITKNMMTIKKPGGTK